jgi:hypothetical protein
MVLSSASMPARRRLGAVCLVAIVCAGSCSLGVASEDDYFGVDKNSCAGHCGSDTPVPDSDPECFCDDVCVESGDCCKDFVAACGYDGSLDASGDAGPGSCAGQCGSSDPQGNLPCFCDDACVDAGDCCSDYASLCDPDAGN